MMGFAIRVTVFHIEYYLLVLRNGFSTMGFADFMQTGRYIAIILVVVVVVIGFYWDNLIQIIINVYVSTASGSLL